MFFEKVISAMCSVIEIQHTTIPTFFIDFRKKKNGTKEGIYLLLLIYYSLDRLGFGY